MIGEHKLPGLMIVLLALCVGGAHADPELLYYVEDGRVVVTNSPPSTVSARPVWTAEKAESAPGQPGSIFDPYIEVVARENGLSVELVKAVALVESGLDTWAESPKGAQGLMQLMPGTARQYGVHDSFDPLQNLQAGARHLRHLLDQFDGDLNLALAAYNAGAGAVRRHGGVPNYRETQDYIRKVRTKMGRTSRDPLAGEGEPVRLVRSPDGSVSLVN